MQKAFDHFNATLFGGKLPSCLITLQRKRGAYGYFSPRRFTYASNPDRATDEIALNPSHFGERAADEVLSTLVHEMVHLWQQHFGTPGRGRYHNAEWAAKMREIGLIPTDTGEPGGKDTGDRVTHLIEAGASFARACEVLTKERLSLRWYDQHRSAGATKKANTRAKFTCSGCGLNAWAKPDATLVCGACNEAMN